MGGAQSLVTSKYYLVAKTIKNSCSTGWLPEGVRNRVN